VIGFIMPSFFLTWNNLFKSNIVGCCLPTNKICISSEFGKFGKTDKSAIGSWGNEIIFPRNFKTDPVVKVLYL
jgi:hypothetical protein